MSNLINEIKKRRTFAIISHPDAGKTTLTEKLLLYGGAIREAGAVKARKSSKHAVSDWMEIEKQRGISVTSSVMQFKYNDFCINILDTPGHQDFSEDTYRTLMAADNAVMVIDGAKGVEAQTRKLFHVCSLREMPIFTFINKVDREIRDPYELLSDIEDELGIKSYPINWPIGCGMNFKGVYDRITEEVIVYNNKTEGKAPEVQKYHVDNPELKEYIGEAFYEKLQEDIELLDCAGDEFDLEAVREGRLTPVFFGSALTNFGVEPFLREFLRQTTPPIARKTDEEKEVDIYDEPFSAFVFKIQANMNKAHRDRIAFMRICSGKFQKGIEVNHIQGGKKVRLAQPQQFMAQEREIIDEAYAGDIIGVFDPGIFSIGDTLCANSKKFKFEGIPSFAPEHFARVKPVDTMKRKQFIKGITQISQEGAIQVFKQVNIGIEEIIVGVVGVLQFEVLEYRLKNEYNVEIKLEKLAFSNIRWIEESEKKVDQLSLTSDTKLVKDIKERPILLFQSDWGVGFALEHNPGLVLSAIGKA